MKTNKISILAIAFLVLSLASAQAAQLARAKVVDVTGTATKYSLDGKETPLKVGDLLKEGDSVSVTALSSAELIFSNGSEMSVKENTSFDIKELQQESFAGNKSYEQLEADPSKSQTLLALNYGKVSGHVKKLQNGSKFFIETPLGTAAIRGTRWTVQLTYNQARGEFVLSVQNVDGSVEMISNIQQALYGSGNSANQEFDSEIDEETTQEIPENHTIAVRIGANNPAFNDLLQVMQNYTPTGPRPTITPGSPLGDIIGQEDGDEVDFDVIVVSPEGGSSTGSSTGPQN